MEKPTKNGAFLIFVGLCAAFSVIVLAAAAISAPPLLPSTAFDTVQTSVWDENWGKVNLNTALKEELVTLPQIGEALAERIIAYREENGPFQTTEEIVNVSGIGKAKWEAIRELICV